MQADVGQLPKHGGACALQRGEPRFPEATPKHPRIVHAVCPFLAVSPRRCATLPYLSAGAALGVKVCESCARGRQLHLRQRLALAGLGTRACTSLVDEM